MNVVNQFIKKAWTSSDGRFDYQLYRTGSFRISTPNDRRFFTLTNTDNLYNEGYIDQLIELINEFPEEYFSKIPEYAKNYEFNEPVSGETLRALFDLNIPKVEKLLSITSYLGRLSRVSKDKVIEAALKQKRMSELEEVEHTESKYRLTFSSYLLPDRGMLHNHHFRFNDEKYVRYCRRVGFFNSDDNMTYGDYLKNLEDENFIPVDSIPKEFDGWQNDVKNFIDCKDEELLSFNKTLFSRALRAKQQTSNVPAEVKHWSYERQLKGLKPMALKRKLTYKDKAELLSNVNIATNWAGLQAYLSKDEFKAFLQYVDTNPTVEKFVKTPSSETIHLFALAFVEKGPEEVLALSKLLNRDVGVNYNLALNAVRERYPMVSDDREFKSYFEYFRTVADAIKMDAELSLDLRMILA